MFKKSSYYILILFITVQNLYGYLDPGTWSYVIQMLAAASVGLIIGIKTFWQNIKIFFQDLFKKK